MKRLGPAALALALLGSFRPAPAQELSLSVSAGGFLATNDVVREIYRPGTPWAAEAWLKFRGPLGLSAGFGRISQTGTALPLGEGGPEYPLKLVRTFVPITVFYQFEITTVELRLGGGVCFHSYREDWRTVDLAYEGRKAGPRVYAAAAWRVAPRISVFGSAAYDSIPTGAGSLVAADVNLGGFQFLGGLSIRIF